jgi:hypothetical protein
VQGEKALISGVAEGDLSPLNNISGAFESMKVIPAIIEK